MRNEVDVDKAIHELTELIDDLEVFLVGCKKLFLDPSELPSLCVCVRDIFKFVSNVYEEEEATDKNKRLRGIDFINAIDKNASIIVIPESIEKALELLKEWHIDLVRIAPIHKKKQEKSRMHKIIVACVSLITTLLSIFTFVLQFKGKK